MDALEKHIDYKDHVYIPYSVESLDDMSYIVFYLERNKGDELSFIQHKEFDTPYRFKGCINWNKTSYLFYELDMVEREFLSADEEEMWKVTPYEILYTRSVAGLPIHKECVDFFKTYPSLFMVGTDEVPIVAYMGLGQSELSEQILLQNKNEKKGMFGRGYYFTTYENAEYDAIYKEETDDYLIRLENRNHLSDKQIYDTSVYIKNDKFYHDHQYLGEVPSCNDTIQYVIYYYDKDVIYLKSTKPNGCKKEVKLRKEQGVVLRYILFLNKHSIGNGKGYDSYAYDSQYMIRHSDHFICLSYHSIKKK